MPIGIVDLLEEIDIAQDQSNGLATGNRLFDDFLDVQIKRIAVGKPREAVRSCRPLQFLLAFAADDLSLLRRRQIDLAGNRQFRQLQQCLLSQLLIA